jgi:hypothetical protein
MNYSEIVFGKSLEELSIDKLQYFFSTPQGETATLEFKSFSRYSTFDKNIDGIIKGLCAFLNSDGGILIWGAPNGIKPEGKKEEVFEGELQLVNELKEKDTIINIISSRITPMPTGISVKILERNDGYAYVFEVQPSPYKPHQFNHIYYIRLDGQSRPAPHYMVQAMFRQVSFPNLEAYAKFVSLTDMETHWLLIAEIYLLNLSEFQNEELAAYQLVIEPGAFEGTGGTFFSNPEPVLYYGRPLRNQLNIIIAKTALEKRSRIFKMVLTLGGKKSPAKISNYVLDFNLFDSGRDEGNLNYLMTKAKENQFYSDAQKDKGSGKEKLLREILGREVK